MAIKNIFSFKMKLWPQWLTGLTVCLGVLTTGLNNGWTSPYLAKLTSENESYLKLTSTEASWVASLLNFGRFFGAIIGAISQGIIGRKNTLLVATIPLTIGWICIITLKSVNLLYIARICCGIGSGMVWTTLSLFIGEIADPKIRGTLIFLNTNAACVGVLLGNAMGPYLQMEEFGYVSLILIVGFIILFYFIPDSPYHYLLNGKLANAEASMKWFKQEDDISKEIEQLKNFIGNNNVSLSSKLKQFKEFKNIKNIIILFMINIFLYFSGHNTISYYAEIIVKKSEISFNASTIVIALSVCTVISGATATVFVDKFGRRLLLILSSIGTCLSLILLGIHFHFLSYQFHWLPIFSLFLYNFSINYGLVPVPIVLVGELFSPNIKTIASMFFSGSSALLSFMTIRSFQLLLDIMDEKYVFWIFAFSAFLTVPFTYFFISETKGQTLIQIQKNLDNKKSSQQNI